MLTYYYFLAAAFGYSETNRMTSNNKWGNNPYIVFIILCILIFAALLIFILIIMGVSLLTWILLRPEKEVYHIQGGAKVLSSDGFRLKAVQNINPDSHKWLILVHGYRSDHSMMNEFARIYIERGYSTLQPDNRAHGSSSGDYIGMGYYYESDILKWIDYVAELDPHAEIILHGVSMGAAAVMILSDNIQLLENVKVIISDSGYTSAIEYVRTKLNNITKVKLRIIPELMSWFADRKAGYSLKEASPLEHVKMSRIPILFIHGAKDVTVPVEHVYNLYQAAACKKVLYICEDAGHGEAAFLDPVNYWEKAFSFIDENSKPN